MIYGIKHYNIFQKKKMKSFGKKHFIFDENNYTGYDINSNEMNILYNKQETLFNKYSLQSFLFIFKGKIEINTNNMLEHLMSFGANINYTVFAIISVDSNIPLIYLGSIIMDKYISKLGAEYLDEYVRKELRNQYYYQALEIFLNKVEAHCDFKFVYKGNPMETLEIIIGGLIIYIIIVIVVSILIWKKGEKCCEKICSVLCPKNNHDANSSIGGYSNGYGGNNSIGRNIYENNNSIGAKSSTSDNSIIVGVSGGAI